MESSEFTKKCQLAEEVLREVLNEIEEDNEDVFWSLNEAANMLNNLAIPEGIFIGKSNMKCLLFEEEDESNSLELGKEHMERFCRWIKLFFDSMDEMGITRMNKEVYNHIRSFFYTNDEFVKKLAESDEAQKNEFEANIREIMTARPDYFEMGKPELEFECDESCRGTQKVVSREKLSESVSCTITVRPDKCLYKDWL